MAVGWVYEADDLLKMGVPKGSFYFYTHSFWICTITSAAVGIYVFEGDEWIGLAIWVGCLISIAIICSILIKREGYDKKKWLQLVFFSGVRKIARHMTLLSDKKKIKDRTIQKWWEPCFEIWWSFSIKYFIPVTLVWIIMWSLRTDLNELYGDYPLSTQFTGVVVVFIFVCLLVIPFFIVKSPEPFGFDVDRPFDEMQASDIFEQEEIAK
jgi:hypothetical protein